MPLLWEEVWMLNRIITKFDECVKVFFAQCRNSVEKSESLIKSYRPTLMGKRFITDAQLSEKLNISRRTLQYYRDSGKIPFIQNLAVKPVERYFSAVAVILQCTAGNI